MNGNKKWNILIYILVALMLNLLTELCDLHRFLYNDWGTKEHRRNLFTKIVLLIAI